MNPVYLDYNATTPTDPRVVEAMLPYFQQQFGNPSSVDHEWGWKAKDAIESARLRVAALIGAAPHEIFFTSGGTESVYLALTGLADACQPRQCRIYYSEMEHESVRRLLEKLTLSAQLQSCRLSVDSNGLIKDYDINCKVDDHPIWLAQMAVNHELGTCNSFDSDIYKKLRSAGLNVFSDLSQAVGKTEVDVKKCGIDLGVFSSHKIYGPKGVGALYVRGGTGSQILASSFWSGSQEQGLRAGTSNVPGIVGFGKACEIAVNEMTGEIVRICQLRNEFEFKLVSAISDLWINGHAVDRVCNTTNIGFGGINARALIRQLKDVGCSTRSACASGSDGPSPILKAIGLSDDECYSCIRFSLGRFTTPVEIEYAVDKIAIAVAELRRLHGNHN